MDPFYVTLAVLVVATLIGWKFLGSEAVHTVETIMVHSHVRCPSCREHIPVGKYWMCMDENETGCRTEFDTFETRGQCPCCLRRFPRTACLHCGAWSAHEDFYLEPPARPEA